MNTFYARANGSPSSLSIQAGWKIKLLVAGGNSKLVLFIPMKKNFCHNTNHCWPMKVFNVFLLVLRTTKFQNVSSLFNFGEASESPRFTKNESALGNVERVLAPIANGR